MANENDSQEANENTEVEIDESALLDAIDEGIAEVSPHLEEDDDNGANDDAGANAEGDGESEGEGNSDEANVGDNDDAAAAAAAEAAAAEGAGDGDGDSNAGDGDGDGDGEGAGAGDGSGEGEGEGEGTGDAIVVVEPDHINDPIPEGTKEQTAARITGLIDIAKTQTKRADQGDQIIGAITDVGADPEQFSNTLGFLELYNSKDPKSRKQALEVARGVVHELSVELGEGSADLLTRHPDLQAEVEADDLTETRAIEIATQRENVKLQTARTEHTTAKDDAAAETTRLITLGKDQLTAFENTVKTDPAYAALYPTFRGILATTLRTVHADQWGATAKSVYENLKANYKPAAEVKPKVPGKQPLRAKQGAGGGSGKEAEPKSGVEAVSAALEGM